MAAPATTSHPTLSHPRRILSFFTPLCLACLLVAASLNAAPFSATLDRSTIGLGETATLTLNFDNIAPAQVPRLPAINQVDVRPGGRSSHTSIINGRTSSRTTFTYYLTPRATGAFRIPPITVTVDNQRLVSDPLTLRVVAEDPAARQARETNTTAFLRLTVPDRPVYLGEAFTAEIQLYVQAAREVSPPELQGDNYTVVRQAEPAQTRTQVGNTVYHLVTFRYSLVPTKPGSQNIGPATIRLTVPAPNARRNVFREILDWETVSLDSGAKPLTVRPLPADQAPPGFNGAIGEFSLTLSANPTNVTVGDPITLQVKISGRGAIESLTLPDQPAFQHFKTYPPSSEVNLSDPLGLRGTKTFEQVVIPEDPAIKELPSLHFSYFDPTLGRFQSLDTDPVPLSIRPAPTGAQPTVVAPASANERPNQSATDIVHIKAYPGDLHTATIPLIQRPAFLALQVLPILALAATLVRRRRLDRLQSNPRLQRRRRVAALTRSGLAELRRHAKSNDSDAFFACTFRLLQEQLGEPLDLPASAITEAVLDEHLRPASTDTRLIDELHALFQLCNQARYAPIRSRHELDLLIPRVESALKQIQTLEHHGS
ncbi:MAG TPA: BatD family protein [Methylomirabilota bacterium]|nr:BatD family protein [Methylomirabilota bacterium]